MFFTIRNTSTLGESEIRLCFLGDDWFPYNGLTPEVMVSGEGGYFMMDFEEVVDTGDRFMNVTLDIDIDDGEGSFSQLDGDYQAVKISDSTASNLGSLKLTSYIIDYSIEGLPKKALFNELETHVGCMTETEMSFMAAVSAESLGRQIVDSITRADTTLLAFDDGELTLTDMYTTTGTKGYLTRITTNPDSDDFYFGLGDSDSNTYNYLNRTTTKHKGNISSVNHLDDYASAEFDLNF